MTAEIVMTDPLADDALQEWGAGPFVESHFPQQISGYAESRHGATSAAQRLGENPWLALAAAFGAGAALAMISGPTYRVGKRAWRSLQSALEGGEK